MPKMLMVLSIEDLETMIEALDEKIDYATHADAVKFKNVRARLNDLLIKFQK